MSGVTIKEYGLRFVWVCLKKYMGGSWPILVIFAAGMLAGIIVTLLSRKKEEPLRIVTLKGGSAHGKEAEEEEEEKAPKAQVSMMFLTITVVCALTVYNPILVRKLIPKLGMTTVYYRFFWILPVTFGAAYYLVRAFASLRRFLPGGALACIVPAACLCAALAYFMPLNPGLPNVRIPTNVYKTDGAIPVLCEAVHTDFEKTGRYQKAAAAKAEITDRTSKKWLKAQAKTSPVCVFPYQLEFGVRQFDPNIRLTFNRNLRLFYEGNTSTGITYGEGNKRYLQRALILDALYGRDDSITIEDFQAAMKKTKTDYLICEESKVNGSFLLQAGCQPVGTVAGYTIFRYDR